MAKKAVEEKRNDAEKVAEKETIWYKRYQRSSVKILGSKLRRYEGYK